MKPLKHSKYKNTGIVFEVLTRMLVSEALEQRPQHGLKLIKKHFNKDSELLKELMLYQSLQERNKNQHAAYRLVDLVIESRRELNETRLNQEKYNLIRDIRRFYALDEFFDTRVSNYRLLASIYKLMEHAPSHNPTEHVTCRDRIVESLTQSQNPESLSDAETYLREQPSDVRKLGFKIIVERFDEKYQGLNPKQKNLLRRYINENTTSEEFRNFVYGEAGAISKRIKPLVERVRDEVLRIKLKETVSLLGTIMAARVIKDEHLSAMLKYYELVDELERRA
jgi:hypothetical protein